jgi:hypothetical protein
MYVPMYILANAWAEKWYKFKKNVIAPYEHMHECMYIPMFVYMYVCMYVVDLHLFLFKALKLLLS